MTNTALQKRAGENAGPTPFMDYGIAHRDMHTVLVGGVDLVTLYEGSEGRLRVGPTFAAPLGLPSMFIQVYPVDGLDFTYQLYLENAEGERIPLNTVPIVATAGDPANQPLVDSLIPLIALQEGEKILAQRDAASASASARFAVETVEIGVKTAGQGTLGGNIRAFVESLSNQWAEFTPPPGKCWGGVPMLFALTGFVKLSAALINFDPDDTVDYQIQQLDGEGNVVYLFDSVAQTTTVPVLSGVPLSSFLEFNSSIPAGWKYRVRVTSALPEGTVQARLLFQEYDRV